MDWLEKFQTRFRSLWQRRGVKHIERRTAETNLLFRLGT
jgi:hypothetical protein